MWCKTMIEVSVSNKYSRYDILGIEDIIIIDNQVIEK